MGKKSRTKILQSKVEERAGKCPAIAGSPGSGPFKAVQKIQAQEIESTLHRSVKWLMIAMALALILRLAFLTEVTSSLFAIPHLFDQATYVQWADGILKGSWEEMNKPYWQGPLYPYLIALIFSLTGKSLLVVRLFQIVIGLFLVCGVFSLTRDLFGEIPALIAAFLTALFRTFIFMESAFLTETILAFLNLSIFIALLYASRRQNLLSWFTAGLVIGIAAVGRGTALVFLPLALAWLLYAKMRKNKVEGCVPGDRERSIRKRATNTVTDSPWILTGALILGLIIPIAPVTIRNLRVSHEFVLLSSNGGLNLFIGNHSGANGTYDLPQGLDTQSDPRGEAYARAIAGKDLSSSKLSAFYSSRVREFLSKGPGAFLSLTMKKLLLFVHAAEISHDDDFDYFKRRSVVMKLPLIPFGILFPLTIMGIIFAFMRSAKRGLVLLAALMLFTSAVSTVAFFVALRYRIPSVPFMIPFAAFALHEIWQKAKARAFPLLVRNLVPPLLVLIICYYPYEPVRELALLSRLQSHNQTSLAYQANGEIVKAIDELKAAITLAPENSSLHLNMGNTLLAIGDRANAEKEYTEAIRLNPANVNAHVNFGTMFEARGDFEGAEREYMQALSIDPKHANAQRNLKNLRDRRSGERVR